MESDNDTTVDRGGTVRVICKPDLTAERQTADQPGSSVLVGHEEPGDRGDLSRVFIVCQVNLG